MAISLTHTTVAVGTDAGNGEIAKAQWNENHTLTQATERLLGRTTAGVGATEEISVGTGLSLSGGTLTNTVTATAPGGSDTQIQFNNAGAFGGASGLTTNGTELTIASGTKTASAPVLNMSQTWNASGVTFTGLRFNVTNTASAVGSLLMDLQVGGTSIFSIRPDGFTSFRISEPAGFNLLDGSGNNYLRLVATSSPLLGLGSNGSVSWRNAATLSAGAYDTSITRSSAGVVNINSTLRIASNGFISSPAAARIQLGGGDAAAPVAQTLSVQSVVAGTTNTAGANLTITGSQGTGTGAGGSIIFQVAPAGSTGSAQNALATALTIASDQTSTFAGAVRALVDGSAAAPSLRLGATEVHGFYRTGGSSIGLSLAGALTFQFSSVPAGVGLRILGNDLGIGFGSTADTVLLRDAANTLALRNGANAQTFNVYNTFTSSTNFERFRIFAQSAAAVLIGTEKGSGGGTARALELQTDGTTRLTINATADTIRLGASGTTTLTFGSNGGDASIVVAGNSFSILNTNHDVAIPGLRALRNAVGFGIAIGGDTADAGGGTSGASKLYGAGQEATNTIAQRNGNNGQTFRIYGRFTDITNNFERFFISVPTTSGAAVQLGTQKGATTGAARALEFQTDGTTRLTIGSAGGLTLADAQDIAVGSTTGTKIGTATTQKIGFYNATPVVQPTAVADATDAATVITQLNALLSRMRDLGLIAT